MLESEEGYERHDNLVVIGGIHCVGTELELLECIHNSIGMHNCGGIDDYFNAKISCTGMW